MPARLRVRGIYLFPSVPNTSGITQEMDQIFDLFKRLVWVNVDLLHEASMKDAGGWSISLFRDDCTKIVFGGTYMLENKEAVELETVFDKAFCQCRILSGFAAVGAVPFTRKCLDNEKVRAELSPDAIDETPVERRLGLLNKRLESCVFFLQLHGYAKAGLLLVKAKERKVIDRPVTVAHSAERQRQFLAATTIDGKYKALNGMHVTHDDMFLARAAKDRAKELKALKEKKAAASNTSVQEREALALIENKEEAGYPVERLGTDKRKWTVAEVNVLLKWKLEKIPPDAGNKDAKIALWARVKSSPAALSCGWTE